MNYTESLRDRLDYKQHQGPVLFCFGRLMPGWRSTDLVSRSSAASGTSLDLVPAAGLFSSLTVAYALLCCALDSANSTG